MTEFICPLCNSVITEEKYNEIFQRGGIDKLLRENIKEIQQKYEAELKRIAQEKENAEIAKQKILTELETLRQTLKEKETLLEKQVEAKIRAQINKETKAVYDEMKKQYQEQIESIKKMYSDQIAELKRANEKHIKELEESHKKEKLLYDEEMKKLKKQVEELSTTTRTLSPQEIGYIKQGEFCSFLVNEFTDDEIISIKRGEKGEDVEHNIQLNGKRVGKILWEHKATQTFQSGWVDKLKQECKAKNAPFGVIVSNTTPQDQNFIINDSIIIIKPDKHLIYSTGTFLRMLVIEGRRYQEQLKIDGSEKGRIYGYLLSNLKPFLQDNIDIIEAQAKNLQRLKDGVDKYYEYTKTLIEKNFDCLRKFANGLSGLAPKLQLPEKLNPENFDEEFKKLEWKNKDT